jgi:hypothetical protein
MPPRGIDTGVSILEWGPAFTVIRASGSPPSAAPAAGSKKTVQKIVQKNRGIG